MDKIAFLRTVPLFRDVSERDLRILARIVKSHAVPKGQLVFAKGGKGDDFYIVEKGVIKIYSESATGKTKTFAYFGPRDFFGEMALLVKEERSASAVAMAPSALLTVNHNDFKKLLAGRSPLAKALLMALCERLRWADREIESLAFHSVLGRLARILLELATRYGEDTPRGRTIRLDISHQELADMAGTAREMVTRLLSRFERVGCLATDGRSITVTDARKLRDWIA